MAEDRRIAVLQCRARPALLRTECRAPLRDRGAAARHQARAVHETHTLPLEPGDGLYLYSDGITEAADASGALFSEDRLAAVSGSAWGGANDLY